MNHEEIIVIGHRNPDIDAICSAVGYAEFKRRTGWSNVVAARCGELAERVRFVLDYFDVPAPRLVSHVAPTVRDVMDSQLIHLPSSATLRDAIDLMERRNIRLLPVLGPERRFEGFVSLFKMSQFLCPRDGPSPGSPETLPTSLTKIARALGAEPLTLFGGDQEEELELLVGAMSLAVMDQRLRAAPSGRLLVVLGDYLEAVLHAIHAKVKAVVLCGGAAPPRLLAEEAAKYHVHLLISPHDLATTTVLLRSSRGIREMVHRKYVSFRDHEPLSEARAKAAASPFQVFPVLDAQGRTMGVLSESSFLRKVNRRLILVDHNELSQAVPGADQVEIIEIIDHHRLGATATRHPILFRNEPVGSTSTIVADLFFRNQVELPQPIAGLLLAGLISDTLNLRSPTSTATDADVLKRLEQLTGVDATVFTETLFATGSILNSMKPDQAISVDAKTFEEQGKSFSIAQIEEMGFEQFWNRKDAVVASLESHREKHGYFFAALFITDVIRQDSLLIIAGASDLVDPMDYVALESGIFEMKGIVSRKKQLLPYLTDRLDHLNSESVRARSPGDEPLTMV